MKLSPKPLIPIDDFLPRLIFLDLRIGKALSIAKSEGRREECGHGWHLQAEVKNRVQRRNANTA
jgi:hypothetical protein